MKSLLRTGRFYPAVLLFLAAVLFFFALGKTGLLDPDEPFYTLTAKEMLERGDWLTPVMFGRPQFEKPILFYWVLAFFFKLLGISEFSARLGPALAGLATVLVTYAWGKIVWKRAQPAFFSALILAASAQFVALSRLVLTDVFLCLFVASSLCAFSLGYERPGLRRAAWRAMFVFYGLGFLTKGPLGFLIPFMGIAAYLLISREEALFKEIPWKSGLLLFAAVGFPWYALMAARHGADFLWDFFLHENLRRFFVAEHSGSNRLYFYPGSFAAGFFPWTAFVLAGLLYGLRMGAKRRTEAGKKFLFLASCFFTPFVFFVLAHSKLMSYLMPAYPAAALTAGAFLYRLKRALNGGAALKVSFSALQIFVCGIFPLALAAGALYYDRKFELQAAVPMTVIAAVLAVLGCSSLFFLFRRRLILSTAFLAALSVSFSGLAYAWLLPQASPVFSTKAWAQPYERLKSGPRPPLFLSSKLFVRGISFYTGASRLGVFSEEKHGGFYTRPSLPIVSDAEDLNRMDSEDFPVYFMLRNKELKALEEKIGDKYSVSVLEGGAQRALIKLERIS